jgi:hypothetical protein
MQGRHAQRLGAYAYAELTRLFVEVVEQRRRDAGDLTDD